MNLQPPFRLLTIHQFTNSPINYFLFLLLLLLTTTPQPAAAHASLARSEPPAGAILDQPPTQITIWFTEPIEPELSTIRVLTADGRQIDNGDNQVDPNDNTQLTVTLPPGLEDGTYTVSWKNVSTVDGHPVVGSFTFTAGQSAPTQPPPAPTETAPAQSPYEPLIRWLVLISILALFGGLSFKLLIIRPALAHFPPGSPESIPAEFKTHLTSRILNLTRLAVILFLLASTGQLILQSLTVNAMTVNAFSLGQSLGRPLLNLISSTYWGQLWLWRMVLFLVLFAVLPLPTRLNSGRTWGQSRERPRQYIALLLSAAILLTLSLISHAAATVEIRLPAILMDFLHLLAAAFWVGGLFHFAAVMPPILKHLPDPARRALLGKVVPRFSVLASLSVTTLILTGLYSSYAQVTILAALNTPYGRTLLIKLALIIPLLALGAINLLRLGRRLVTQPQAPFHLRRTVSAEAILSILVLLTVGYLITLEPARQVASREGLGSTAPTTLLTLEETAENLTGTLTLDPAGTGNKQLTLALTGQNGRPIENASDVILTLTYPAESFQPPAPRPTNTAPGHYQFESVPLSLAGQWQTEFLIIRPTAFDTRLTYEFQIAESTAPPTPDSSTISPSPQTAALLFAAILAILALTLVLTLKIALRH